MFVFHFLLLAPSFIIISDVVIGLIVTIKTHIPSFIIELFELKLHIIMVTAPHKTIGKQFVLGYQFIFYAVVINNKICIIKIE